MKDLTEKALEKVRSLGASYGDIRIVKRAEETILAKNGKIEGLTAETDEGFGIRVLADGAWGFASSLNINPQEIDSIAEMAVRIARASGSVIHDPVELSPVESAEGSFGFDVEKDPFEVPIEDKISLLLDANRVMMETPEIRVAEAGMQAWHTEQVFASTEGSYIEQSKTECGAGIEATAVSEGDVQRRSYPASGGDFAIAGYEYIEGMNLLAHADRVAKEAAQLLTAPQCPTDVRSLILEGSMLALQVHESCGHPIELDRVFGTEAAYAGTSFLTPDKLDTFRYGSDMVNIVADATVPGGLGSFFFDDEGVPAQRAEIIKEGIFTGYLTSRETAPLVGAQSDGAMRADGWNRTPIIRMTNINLEPDDWTVDEIIGDTENGLYAETVLSWSIDDKRLNFQFATEVAYDVQNGSLGRMYKNPTYTGITYEFWSGCDAVASEDEWHIWGVTNCGKGEPMQEMHVGHGVAPSRFRDVRIGVIESPAGEAGTAEGELE
ncbi:MAG TPA: TldD/PmbA family protein [Armatimonadota bacterium]